MKEITERQRAVLTFITDFMQRQGYAPTLREIGKGVGVRSTNGVNDHLRALERKGYLTRDSVKGPGIANGFGKARTIRILGVALPEKRSTDTRAGLLIMAAGLEQLIPEHETILCHREIEAIRTKLKESAKIIREVALEGLKSAEEPIAGSPDAPFDGYDGTNLAGDDARLTDQQRLETMRFA